MEWGSVYSPIQFSSVVSLYLDFKPKQHGFLDLCVCLFLSSKAATHLPQEGMSGAAPRLAGVGWGPLCPVKGG